MAVEFASFRELLMNVFYHLVPAYFRISYSFYLPNVMIDQIKHQYASIYEMTRKALLPLERRIGKSIPEEEIGFFTILFGGEIRKADAEERNRKIRAVSVCPSGISSSLILKSELQQLFPMIFLQRLIQLTAYTRLTKLLTILFFLLYLSHLLIRKSLSMFCIQS